jgi:hypothetical protein
LHFSEHLTIDLAGDISKVIELEVEENRLGRHD